MESSRRDLLIDMAKRRPILKNNQNTYHPHFGFTPNSLPQTGFFVFNVRSLSGIFLHRRFDPHSNMRPPQKASVQCLLSTLMERCTTTEIRCAKRGRTPLGSARLRSALLGNETARTAACIFYAALHTFINYLCGRNDRLRKCTAELGDSIGMLRERETAGSSLPHRQKPASIMN